jgi:zinc/manganese transport system substrate-binding protein
MLSIRKSHSFVLSVAAIAALAACTQAVEEPGPAPVAEAASEPVVLTSPSIVATTSILGSVAEQIATCVADKDDAISGHVRTLLPIGTDTHDFQPSSEQVAAMLSADIVIANGLFLEEGLMTVFEQLEADGANLWLTAEWIEPIEFAGLGHDDHGHDDHGHDDHGHDDHGHDDHGHDDHGDHDHGDHDHGDHDPHFWFDMSRMAAVSTELGSRLASETGDAVWADCGVEVASSISAAEENVMALFDQIDTDKRLIITDHDAFAYLADRYGFEIAGVVIPGGSTLAEATSADLARLVAQVSERGIRALIGNVQQQNRLLDAIAGESGGTLQVVPIYVESIGEPGTPAADYQGMMIWNAQQIVEALQD